MAIRDKNFRDIVDYNKIDSIIAGHFFAFSNSNIDLTKRVNQVNQLFLFSGGSATTVGALVKEEQANGGFADSVFKIDSETAAQWGVIRNLSRDAQLTKHAEKLRPIDILRGNAVVARLFLLEDVKSQTPPFSTTKSHLVQVPIFGDVAIPKNYVFSDSAGNAFFSGERHDQAFQAVLRYVSQKVFEVANKTGIKTSLVIDDHLEDLDSAKQIISTAKSHSAQTMFIQSYVKPEVAIERGAQRFRHEGGSSDISYRINRYMQIRTHLHQPRNWLALRELVDGAILTHRNIEGQAPVIVQRCFTDEDGKLHIRTGENKESWFASFLKIDNLPKDPTEALYQLGFAPSTSKFASFAALSNGGNTTAAERLAMQRETLHGWDRA